MKFRLTSLVCILFAFVITNSYSQDSNSVTQGIISGKVSDALDNQPVEANVVLFSTTDNSKTAAVGTDSTGHFKLSGIPFGVYRIEFSSTGYKPLKVDNIKLDESNKIAVVLDTIKLSRTDVTTEELVVEDKKPMMTLEGDKKVFNVDRSTLSKGGTALDVLKKVPLIDVDMNDNVTLRGSQNAKILIDNKPNHYVNLKQLPSDAIEKVEIITNPSAKYESEGVTGIINIVLKKVDAIGYTGYANLGIGSKDKYNAGLSLNVKKKKVTFFGSVYGGIYSYTFSNNALTEYFPPVSSFLESSGSGHGRSNYAYGSFGGEYEFNSSHTLGIEGNYTNSKYTNIMNNRNNNLDSLQSLASYYTRDNNFDGTWKSYSASLYYTGKFNDKGRELTGDFSFTGNKNNNTSLLQTQNYNGNGTTTGSNPFIQKDLTDNKSQNINLQLDYTHPITDKTKFEAGYKGVMRINDNDFASDTLDYSLNQYVENTSTSNHFKLTDRINAVYGVFSSGYKDFSFKVGLRAEHTYTKGELLSNSQSFTKNYVNLFPSASVTQKIGMMNSIQLAYSRRITRPMIYRLNPFVNKYDPKFIMVGNPDLNPEFTDSYELSFMFFSNIVTVTPMAFFRQTHDIITSYSRLVDSNVSLTTFRNAAGSKSYGMDFLVSSSRSIPGATLNATLSFYKTKFDSDASTDYTSEEGFSWKANIRSSVTIPGIVNLELYYNYNGKRFSAQGYNVPSSSFDIGVSKTFLKDKATVSLRASDVFSSMEWGQNITAAGYKYSFHNEPESRTLFLNLSYSFGNTDEYYQKKKKLKQNQNEGNDQQDNNGMGR